MSKKICQKRHFLGWGLWVGLCLAVGGCGLRDLATGKVVPPEVFLQQVTFYPPESQCWPWSATLRVANPNPEPLRVLGYDYAVVVEGAELVQGESAAALTLPAGGETLVEVPILLRLNAVPRALQALLAQEQLSYELAGGIRLASVLGGMRVPFRFRGVVTRQEGLERLREFLGPPGARVRTSVINRNNSVFLPVIHHPDGFAFAPGQGVMFHQLHPGGDQKLALEGFGKAFLQVF